LYQRQRLWQQKEETSSSASHNVVVEVAGSTPGLLSLEEDLTRSAGMYSSSMKLGNIHGDSINAI
jgi:hypothetical protein